MPTTPQSTQSNPAPGPVVRASFYALALFYGLVAFEFFYMASPFALYLYGAYLPALGALTALPGAGGLSSFFLPHYVDATSSVVVRWHEWVGAALLGSGALGFVVAAAQVYHAKLTRRGAVVTGAYRWVRHPQYTAFAVAGAGLALLWPRFIALVLWITMLFAYRWLARVEERECERRYGEEYRRYASRTGGFFPRSFGRAKDVALYALALLAALGAGTWLRATSLDHLQALYSEDAAFVAVTDTDPEALGRVVRIAREDDAIRARLGTRPARFINYVLPEEWYVPEVPMNPPTGGTCHHTPRVKDAARYRVVFTRVDQGGRPGAMGREILSSAHTRSAVLEAIIDLREGRVAELAAPHKAAYVGVPVPVL